MTTVFGDSGLTISTLAEVILAIANRYKAAYGDNVRVDDPDGVVGRNARILSETKHDVLTELAATVAALLPSTSSVTLLEELVKFNGITRNVASKSTATVTITANAAGCTVPAGSLVATSDGVQFETDAQIVVASGLTGNVAVTAVEEGAQEAAAGTITTILTPVYGWASVTNAAAATPGDARETDPQLRARRWDTAQGTGPHSPAAILSALKDINGVTKAMVEVNNGNATNSNGVPGHTIRAIVAGGAAQDIGDSLFGPGYGSVGSGVGTYGTESVACTDSDSGQSGTVYYDIASAVDIYIEVRTRKLSDYPAGGDDFIKAAIVDLFDGELEINDVAIDAYGLGDNVTSGQIYTPCNSVQGHLVQAIYVEKAASPSETEVEIDNDEYATTATAKITITAVT